MVENLFAATSSEFRIICRSFSSGLLPLLHCKIYGAVQLLQVLDTVFQQFLFILPDLHLRSKTPGMYTARKMGDYQCGDIDNVYRLYHGNIIIVPYGDTMATPSKRIVA